MVEDSENDALLLIREIKKGAYNAVYERVDTAAAMKKALKEKKWDIILLIIPNGGFTLLWPLISEGNKIRHPLNRS